MKRDWETVRELLLEIEENDGIKNSASPEEQRKRAHHTALLLEEGILAGPSFEFFNDCITIHAECPLRLSWRGHDLLAAIRDDTVWEKTKDQAGKTGGAMTLAVLTQLATHYLLQKLGMGGN